MFGKLMQVSDELMWKYYTYLTDLSIPQIDALRAQVDAGTLHPMQAKKDLAARIVKDFHSADAATKAAEDWAKQFQKDEVPESVEEITVSASSVTVDGESNGNLREISFQQRMVHFPATL